MPGTSSLPRPRSGPATANWSNSGFGVFGTDFNATSESSVLFVNDTPVPSWQFWPITDLVQKWINNPASNHGLVLWADNEDVNGYDLRFRSSDDGQPEQPELEVAWHEPVRSVYYLKDHLGSVRATVDDIGQVVGYDDYGPWGMQLAGRSMTAQGNLPNKFTGKERDTDFGFDWDYFGARYYDAEVGRYPSLDPLAGERPWESPYSYTGNNPLNRYDPDGRYWIVNHNGQYTAYGYPLGGAITMNAVGFVPLAGLVNNSIRRFGFSDYTVSGASWALSVLPADKYWNGLKYVFGGASTFDDIRQSKWDAQTFSLATNLGLASDNSGALLSINLDNLVNKLRARFPKLSEKEQKELIDRVLKSMENFFKWDGQTFIREYGEETYNKYKAAQNGDDDSDSNSGSNSDNNDWWDEYDPSKR